MNHVLLCVTLKTDLTPTWFQAYNEIAFYGPNFQTEVLTIYDFRADEARNKAFWKFKEDTKFDHILFLDSDLCIPSDTIPRLLAHQKDIIGGLYMLKEYPFPPTMFEFYRKPDAEGKNFRYQIILDFKPGDLVKCDGLATGCMMISRKVVETMPEPWFSFRDMGTEDIFFCRQAQKYGFDIWCDTSVEGKHLRTVPVTPGDYWGAVRRIGGMAEIKKVLSVENLEQQPWHRDEIRKMNAKEGTFGEVPA
jgi:hypothetical protein